MTRSTYSFYGSKFHFVMDDKVVEAYNGFLDKYYEAQRDFRKVHGRQWDPMKDPLTFRGSKDLDRQKKVFDDIGEMLTKYIKENQIEILEEDMTEDHLVKVQ